MGATPKIPDGFELETPTSAGPQIPAGFELETAAPEPAAMRQKRGISFLPRPPITINPQEAATQALAQQGIAAPEPIQPPVDPVELEAMRQEAAAAPLQPERAPVLRPLANPAEMAADVATRGLEPSAEPAGGEAVRGAKELATPGKRVQGAARMIAGAAGTALPLVGSAALEAPVSTAASLGAGQVASEAAGRTARALGADRDTEDLVRQAAFYAVPALAAGAHALGLQGFGLETPEVTARGVASKEGGFKAAVAKTPEAYEAGVEVAGKRAKVRIPRAGAQPEAPGLEPPTIEGEPAAPPEASSPAAIPQGFEVEHPPVAATAPSVPPEAVVGYAAHDGKPIIDLEAARSAAPAVANAPEPPQASASVPAPPSEAESDPLFDAAVAQTQRYGKASTSQLQRSLGIGYGRAAHLIDQMEQAGIVGPAQGPGPRPVLAPAQVSAPTPAPAPAVAPPAEAQQQASGSPELPEGFEFEQPGAGPAHSAEAGFATPAALIETPYLLGKAAHDLLTSEAEKVRQSRQLHEGLYDLESQQTADRLRAVQWMNKAPGTAKDWEAIYHHQENPAEPVTPEQQRLAKDVLEPIAQENQRIYSKLTEGGMPVENYVHRVVRDRGSALDRMLRAGKEGRPGGAGNVLSQSAAATKGRSMMALQSEASGRRVVVSIKGGRVTAFSKNKAQDLGPLQSGITSKFDLLSKRLEPVANRIMDLERQLAEVPKADRQERVTAIEQRIRDLDRERAVLLKTPSRVRSTFERRKHITEEIEQLEKRRQQLQATPDVGLKLSRKAEERRRQLNESLTVARSQRSRIIESTPTESLADRVWVDKNGRRWRIRQATTKEIEASTGLRYYHNALASTVSNYLELRRAERAFDFLESFKNSPHFAEVAFKLGTGVAPDGWRRVHLDQFRGYVFRPHEAEVLNWFAKRMERDPVGFFEKAGNFLRTAIFFNPLIHVPNISVHFAVEKGLRGYLPDRYGVHWRAALKAIDAVVHQNKDFLAALDAGAPLQSQRFETRQLNQLLFEKMAQELGQNPRTAGHVAKALGVPFRLVKGIYHFSGQVTWLTNDIAVMQAVYEKTARGMSLKDAIRETGKHIPTYRLPTRILDSPALGKLMSYPNLTMFGAYHYGALASYGHMLKSLFAGKSFRERAHGLDLLVLLGLVTFVLFPELDKLVKALSGEKDAELRRAGASTFLYNAIQVLRGEKSPQAAIESTVTPAVQFKAAIELAENRNLYTGRRIYDPHAPAGTLAWQLEHGAGNYVAPVQIAGRASQGVSEAKRIGMGLFGVSLRKHGAQRVAQQIATAKASQEAPTPESYRKSVLMRSLYDAAEGGDLRPARQALHASQISPTDYRNLVRASRGYGLVDRVKDFKLEELQQVYKAGTPEERKQLEPLLRRRERQERMKTRQQPPAAPSFLRRMARAAQ